MTETGNKLPQRPIWRSTYGIGVLVVLGILFFFLWTEHRAHLMGYLPLLLLFLLCPLMHFFMHRGHHKGHRDHSDKGDNQSDKGGQP